MEDPIAIFAVSRSTETELPARAHLWPLIIIVLVLLAVAVGFFGSKNSQGTPLGSEISATPQATSRVYVVSYRFGVFSPTNLRIHVGDTVRFRNDSASPVRIVADLQPNDHTPQFDSIGGVQPSSFFSYTFATVGIFGYYNAANPEEAGAIIVR